MDDILNLRGVALSKHGSTQKFAESMSWSRNKAKRILDGIQEPSPTEITAMAENLNIKTYEMFMTIFFPGMSTKWSTV